MKEIKLTHRGGDESNLVALVDDEDYSWLNKFKWYVAKRNHTYYAETKKVINKKLIRAYMHRLILNPPIGMKVDHIDHNGLNNQKYNIRICTDTQNCRNITPSGKSKYLGVSFKKGKYIIAQIMINKINLYLGIYKTEEEAARAYDAKAKEEFGEFANLNFR